MEDNYTLEDLQNKLDDVFSDETCVLNIYSQSFINKIQLF